MFITPPPAQFPEPPRITSAAISNIFAETSNTYHHVSTPELQLVLSEGGYTLRDELILAQPPPHPTDVPIPSNNPLDTSPAPVIFGSTLSIISTIDRPRPKYTNGHAPGDRRESAWSLTDVTRPTSQDDAQDESKAATDEALSKDTKDLKRRKPKTGVVKSSSTFLSRVLVSDSLSKRLSDRDPNGAFAVVNIGRALQWLDLSSDNKGDHLTKLYFTKTNVLCHDINATTQSSSHLDIIVGFSTGDLIWFEPLSQKYTRLNKNGQIYPSPVVAVKWLPNNESLFIAAHMDGSLVVYDKEKDDAAFVPEESMSVEDGPLKMDIKKSLQSKAQKTIPAAVYQISMDKPNALAFAPDDIHLAIASEDGSLRIVDLPNETVVDVYRSYYGGLTTVAWSPDGRYILTGGQDDLVSVWSFPDRALVARCQGHSGWVTHVQFDPWRCDDRGYRFGSVGEDCKLLLWDFSLGMLRKPKFNSARHRSSVASGSVQRQAVDNASVEDDVFHPVESRLITATMPPIMSKQIGNDPLSSLAFEQDCIIVTSKEGHIRTWDRP